MTPPNAPRPDKLNQHLRHCLPAHNCTHVRSRVQRLCTVRCIVIEDSLIGLQAALGAGMRCAITTTPSTASQDFVGAAAVYPELGDGDTGRIAATDLLALLDTPVPAPVVA